VYFAFVGFYTIWLIPPSILGVLLVIQQLVVGHLDTPLVPLYSVGMALWSTLFILFWQRKNVAVAHEWGLEDYKSEEVRWRLGLVALAGWVVL